MLVSNILRTFVPILTHLHNFIIKALDDSVVFLYVYLLNICLFPQVNWGLNKDKERAVCVCVPGLH